MQLGSEKADRLGVNFIDSMGAIAVLDRRDRIFLFRTIDFYL